MSPPRVLWINGRMRPRDDLSLPSGLRQGDGVFETIRTYGGVPFRLTDHLGRLLGGARSIGLSGLPSPQALREAVRSTLTACRAGSASREWVLRPCLFSEEGKAGALVLADPWTDPRPPGSETMAETGISPYRHPGEYLRPPGASAPVKWLARGPLAHALRDARSRGWDEALLRNEAGEIVEGTRSNLFVLDRGRLIAPGLTAGALPGITRGIVVELAGERGIEVEDRPLGPHELLAASEAFLTSSLLGVTPVSALGGVPIATSGRTLTRELREAFEGLARRENTTQDELEGDGSAP